MPAAGRLKQSERRCPGHLTVLHPLRRQRDEVDPQVDVGPWLRDKLREEVEEFPVPDNDPKELAGILEAANAPARQVSADRSWRSCP